MINKPFITNTGFTLIELLITIGITGILAAVAVPTYSGFVEQNQLSNAVDKTQQYLVYARSEAVKNNTDVTISITQGANWCIGFSDTGACNCKAANSCQINLVEKVVDSSGSKRVSLSATADMVGANFDPERGLLEKLGIPVNGSMGFSVKLISATIDVNLLGRPSACSDDVSRYNTC